MAVIATNKKGVKRTFTDRAWSFLTVGKDGTKDGWTAMAEQPISNRAAQRQANKPATGNTNGEVKPVVEQKIKNRLGEKTAPVIEKKGEETKASGNSGELDKASWLRAVEGINPSVIKDFFDKHKIKYSKKDTPEMLYELLGQELKFDVVELQKLFA